MARIFISVGSNVDREQHIRAGVKALYQAFDELEISSVFESEPVGFNGHAFYNFVVAASTELEVLAVVAILKQIERDNGRLAGDKKFAPRTLDLDLLLYDDLITEVGVQLPRGEIPHNAFVLWPLAELAPDRIHPELEQSYEKLWQAYDKSSQKLWKIPFIWNS
ncbi:2-amino-4-hydroxy-6-hydroxymethyldihydropteridine diphosphokinase [Motilimonas pumila]|uniref:2-amino-4-hydroxy-6-hydroxymethyldihydropteridine diphosphokinase n=1 Tax=Motilimonas pumila TaxID=2303987 RepID=A0A418YAS8_9GAMM|nr:2-amino-4-hydroxy-6-hydroxymethyldihydropteridine diphosphokinase [Motilimonas pumila]RJG40084.1 2-amino-4-hydroxy-6-hydroxymethyldihydropteridine diphosphokinase [Motilimonas pumila]